MTQVPSTILPSLPFPVSLKLHGLDLCIRQTQMIYCSKRRDRSRTLWHMPLITELRRQRKVDHMSEAILGY
jgi:hypothetical protein